ncbi:MAG: choice-of-anchor J domain-containing protein, partial [Actinobacteria bacterium]|nr:choice-of-anchor J domain-containing protein [Actinomycetota bacterium]
VTGIVEGNDGVLQEGAMVSLEGYDDYMVMTEADGSFEIADVFEDTYTLTVAAEGYEVYVDEAVEIDGADLDLGTITIIEVIVEPANLQVDVDGQAEGNALLTWSDVAEREFRYDDGTATGQLGSGGGTLNTVLGSAHRNDAVLTEMSWYLTAEGGPHSTVTVWVFGLDENGQPNPGDVLYEMAGVPNTDEQWNTYEFTAPVEAPNGFLIGLSYAGFLAIGTDAGTSTEWPFMPNSNFFVGDYTADEFSAIEGLGDFPYNFTIRAFGIDNGEIDFGKDYVADNTVTSDLSYSKLTEPVVTGFPVYNNHNSVANKAFTGYNVFLDGDEVASEITDMEYLFEDLDEGAYTAGVQSVYTTGESAIITVDFDMVFGVPVTFTVTTNSGDSPEGAHVLLTNQDNDQYVYEHTVGADGEAYFETVRKGMYTLHITHDLFHDYIVADIDIQDEFTYTAEMEEIINEPYGLMVETEGLPTGDAHFSWNNATGWSESFEGGVLPEGWDQVITNTGSQAGFPSTWHITGTVELTTPIVPQDGDYQAFMMWSFDNQDEWLITPEFTAPMGDLVFWYYGTNGSPNADNYYVKASVDGGDTWEILWNASDLPEEENAYATPAVIDLSDYAGQDIHIAWNNVDGPTNDGMWFAWAIDNISVGGEKIDVRDLMVYSNPQQGHNDAARDGEFRKPVTIEGMNYNFAEKAFMGYNVFLNGDEVASEITDTEHNFTGLPGGTHTAGVQSVYTSGVSEIMTIDFEVEMPEFARAQIIHNSADLAASEVDIFVNGEIFVEGLAFRSATPFVDVPAEDELTLDVAPANAGIEASVFNFDVTFDADETYVIVANGIVSDTGYDPAPAFTVYPFAPAREAAMEAEETDLLVFHGATDAPEVSVWAMGGENALFNFEYGDFAGYLSLPTADYVLEVRTADGETVVAAYQAPLETLELEGAALTVVASGFLNPENNSDGPGFGLWVATNMGGELLELPLFTNVNDLTGEFTDISLFPNPVRDMVKLVSTLEMQQVRVFDISGRIVYSNTINSEEYQINTEHFESGMYFVRITTAEGIFTGKLQVQK